MDFTYWLQTCLGLMGMGLFWDFTPVFLPVMSFTWAFFSRRDFSSARARGFKYGLFLLAFAAFQGVLGMIYAALGEEVIAVYQTTGIKVLWAVLFAAGGWLLWIKEIPAAVEELFASCLRENRAGGLRFLWLSGFLSVIFLPSVGKDYAVFVNYAASVKDIPGGFITFLCLAAGFVSGPAALAAILLPYQEKIFSGGLYPWLKRMLAFLHFLAAACFMVQVFAWENEKLKAAAVILSALFAVAQSLQVQRATSRRLIQAAALLAFLAGAAGLFQTQRQGVTWEAYSVDKLKQAREQGVPVVMDFSATWCVPCHEMERYTFSDPQVMEKLRPYLKLKVDVTDPDNEPTQAAAEKYAVMGIPTIVFLDRQGQEVKASRIDGYASAKEFLSAIPAAKGSLDS